MAPSVVASIPSLLGTGTSPPRTAGAGCIAARTRRSVVTGSAPRCSSAPLSGSGAASSTSTRCLVRHARRRHAAHLYAGYLEQFAVALRLRIHGAPAAQALGQGCGNFSAYFVTGKKGKESLQESVMAPDMPRSIIHVSTTHPAQRGHDARASVSTVCLVHRAGGRDIPRRSATDRAQAVAGTLDLSVDAFLPSPRRLAQILARAAEGC